MHIGSEIIKYINVRKEFPRLIKCRSLCNIKMVWIGEEFQEWKSRFTIIIISPEGN